MKLKRNKKKIIILIVSFLVILLGFGTFKGYQDFCYDQHQTAMDMDSMMKLFSMQLQLPNEKVLGIWSDKQEYKILHDVPFDTGVFARYLIKKATFQEIEYKDVEPQWSLSPTQNPNRLSTTECLKNFNENLLYNPEYEQDKRDAEFNKPLAMEDLLNNTKKVVDLKDRLIDITKGVGSSLDELTINPCPSQYLPK